MIASKLMGILSCTLSVEMKWNTMIKQKWMPDWSDYTGLFPMLGQKQGHGIYGIYGIYGMYMLLCKNITLFDSRYIIAHHFNVNSLYMKTTFLMLNYWEDERSKKSEDQICSWEVISMFLQGDKNQSNFASFFTAFQTETLPKKQSNHGFSTGQISLIFIV